MSNDLVLINDIRESDLADKIDKYLSPDEQLVAEALGALIYKRSLVIKKSKEYSKHGYIYSGEGSAAVAFADPSLYGVDWYKYLGYRLLIMVKGLVIQGNYGKDQNSTHDASDYLAIMFGQEARRCWTNPRSFSYDIFD